MSTADTLLARIEEHCRAVGMAESTFGRTAVNDGKLVARLRSGGSITLRTLARIEAALTAPAERERLTDRAVGARISLRRRQLGLTADDLAAMLGLAPQRLRQFEAGAARVEPARLCAVALALNAPVGSFFAPAALPPAARPRRRGSQARLAQQRDAADLLSAYARIGSSPLRRAVLALALYLADATTARSAAPPPGSTRASPRRSRPRGR